MALRFEIFREQKKGEGLGFGLGQNLGGVSKGDWRWRLKSGNNVDIIATSGEGYRNRSDCLDGIRLVMSTTDKTPVLDVSGDGVEIVNG